ncbi:desulfoferrodoxin [Patescibacteria group bacterium]
MIEIKQIYKCNICGNVVEVLHDGVGSLICCNQPMVLLKEKTEDEGQEKHLPVIERKENKAKVKVSSTPHPMEEKHYIQWIELSVNDQRIRQYLTPKNKPETEFEIQSDLPKGTQIRLEARQYCNLHGLWKSKN